MSTSESSRLSFQAFHALYAAPWYDYVYLQTASREVARDTVREAFARAPSGSHGLRAIPP
ncbi:hypothetical protein [Streptomyces sp. SID3343]|uniref:hypothetical protein n=1 Tax=Streptomyces sp. SID3343 TaxID=2690260 RepID=UPI00136D5AD8|nr:hypothetical protein [Streptomyces sp. SID3343]MYW05624.1 hypothetical protein [Streptomyces sp. SID3343]